MSRTVSVGDGAFLGVVATGSPAPTYQWRKDGANIAGATAATLALGPARSSAAGNYTVIVTNIAGSVMSAPPAVLAVNAAAPGMVVAWGDNRYGQTTVPVAARSGVVAMAGGLMHTLALKGDGTVVAWGDNSAGQTSVPVAAQSGVVAVAGGYFYSAALINDGTVVVWGGDNTFGTMNVPVAAQSGVVAIAAGGRHILALKSDGSVVAWGSNSFGTATVPAAAQTGVVAIAAGFFHSVALKSNGTVVTWGAGISNAGNDYEFGQSIVPVAAQNGVVAIAAHAGGHHTVALKQDGTVVAWGAGSSNAGSDPHFGQSVVPVAAQSGVTAIAAGAAHTAALKSDGTVVAWGYNGVGPTASPAGLSGVAALGAGGYFTLALTSAVQLTAPLISTQPQSQTITAGRSAAFSVVASGSPPLTYQWRKNGMPISGATGATFNLGSARTSDAGAYSVVVTSAAGTVISRDVTLVVSPAISKIINLSVRTTAGAGAETLIAGFVIAGEGPAKPVLIRGIGPTLSAFTVPGFMADPALELYRGPLKVAENDNWGDSLDATQISQAMTASGAFPLATLSRDAAMYVHLPSSGYSAQVSARAGTGIALVELYDTETMAAPTRLANVSARSSVGIGTEVLIAGFVIQGNMSKTVVVRAIGPTLATFGVGGTLADPQLALQRGNSVIATNDDWWRNGGLETLTPVFSTIGAFPLVNGTRDAALVTTLEPGAYTVTVSGVGNTTGVALVEIYEVP